MKTNNLILKAAAFLSALFTAADSAFAQTWTLTDLPPYGPDVVASSADVKG